MKTKTSLATPPCPKTMAGRIRSACAARLLPLLLVLTLPAAVQAQFNYTTNNGTIAITGYTGSGGAVTIPATINDRCYPDQKDLKSPWRRTMSAVGLGTVSYFPRIGDCPPGFRIGQCGKATHYHTLRWRLALTWVASIKNSSSHLQEGPVLRSHVGALASRGCGCGGLVVAYAGSLQGNCVGRSIDSQGH